ncbi:unnamed protein product, partial [Cyprideis torosa]
MLANIIGNFIGESLEEIRCIIGGHITDNICHELRRQSFDKIDSETPRPYLQGAIEQAALLYVEIIEKFGESHPVLYNLAHCLFELENYTESSRLYNRALLLSPNDLDTAFNLALSLKNAGQVEAAVRQYLKILEKYPAHRDCLYNLASCYHDQEKDELALSLYEKLVQADKTDRQSLNNAAYLYHKQGKFSEAIAAYSSLVQLDPGHENARYMLDSLTGQERDRAPKSYVKDVFDAFAKNYDTSMEEDLAYLVPQLLREHIPARHKRKKIWSALDLGCGTGLCGQAFQDISPVLIGVDISANMLARAREKMIYPLKYVSSHEPANEEAYAHGNKANRSKPLRRNIRQLLQPSLHCFRGSNIGQSFDYQYHSNEQKQEWKVPFFKKLSRLTRHQIQHAGILFSIFSTTDDITDKMTKAQSSRYSDAGVDIDKGNQFVSKIRDVVASTHQRGVLNDIGGFSSLYAIDNEKYKQPVLVTSTDGVGSKLSIAQMAGNHKTIGIDLVAMCVNDIIVGGATPLCFLDYFSVGKLDIEIAADVVAGIAEGCRQAKCSLVGGETAEMPGLYKPGDYDLAGFTVGIIERNKIIDGSGIRVGDTIIGLASSGLHSNGYSLVRKICFEELDLDIHDYIEEFGCSLAEELLKPTRIYVQSTLNVLKSYTINGMVHNTGGGFYDNIPRILPKGCQASIDCSSWPIPPIFTYLQQKGKITAEEMFRVFNMGIGLLVITNEESAADIVHHFSAM